MEIVRCLRAQIIARRPRIRLLDELAAESPLDFRCRRVLHVNPLRPVGARGFDQVHSEEFAMPSPKKIVWPLVAAVAIAGGSYFGSMTLTHSTAIADSAQTARPTPSPGGESVATIDDMSKAFRAVHHA